MVNDMTILGGIITAFIIIGVVLPYINEDLGADSPEIDVEGVTDDMSSPTSLSGWAVIGSVFSMFFWTFGALPVWLDLCIFLPVRIVFALIIARNIWIGGGG